MGADFNLNFFLHGFYFGISAVLQSSFQPLRAQMHQDTKPLANLENWLFLVIDNKLFNVYIMIQIVNKTGQRLFII